MDGKELFDRIVELSRGFGIVDVGVADADAWETDPLVSKRIGIGRRPKDIMSEARSVISIGIPMQRTIVETAPSIYYNNLYGIVNSTLDHAGERIALELGIEGHLAVYVPRDGYQGIEGLLVSQDSFFSHRHSAYLAGMGTFGWNNLLLTERYGPRIRFTSIITSAELPCGSPMDKNLCIECGRCRDECPMEAIGEGPYPENAVDKRSCVTNSASLSKRGISPCGRCIAVCPVGNDRGASPIKDAVDVIKSYKRPLA